MENIKYISIPQLAKILNTSRIAVYKKVKSGEIEAIRVGKNYAISEKFVLENMGKLIKRNKERSESAMIELAVDKAFNQYKETFKKLGSE